MSSVALTVGFAWRRSYGLAVDIMTAMYGAKMFPKNPREGERICEILVGLPLLALLLPMHYYYIVPKTLPLPKGQLGFKYGIHATVFLRAIWPL